MFLGNYKFATDYIHIPFKIFQHHIGLGQILISFDKLPIYRIWHNVDRSSPNNEYLGHRLRINPAFDKQSFNMLSFINRRFLKHGCHWIKCQLSYLVKEIHFFIITKGCKKLHRQHKYHVNICRWSFSLVIRLLPILRLRRNFFPIQFFLAFSLHPPFLCPCQSFSTPLGKLCLLHWLIANFP